MKYIHLFLLSVFCTSCGQKSETNDTVTPYGPNTMVRNVKKGKNGTILMAASFGGVFRYDGKSFTKLTSKLGSPRFWDVLEDRRGNLWLSSTNSGVYYYNGEYFKHFSTREGLASNAVTSIYEDKSSNIWFVTGAGASRYDGKSFQNFTTKEGLSSNSITTIMEDKTGKLWFGTTDYLNVYDGKTFTKPITEGGKAFKNVRSVIQDKQGNIWLGGNDGLWRYDGSTFTNIARKFIGHIYEDSKGNIWTSGEVNASEKHWTLSRYDQKSLYNKTPAVTEIMSINKMLFGILEADDGSIWFGSMNGVYRYDGKKTTDFKEGC